MNRSWLLRLVVSSATLLLLFQLVPVASVLDGMRLATPGTFFLVVLGFISVHGLAAIKWWFLLERPFGLRLAVQAHFAGLAANLCLPGVIGGDAMRAAIVFRQCRDKTALVAGSIVDRVVDLLALLFLASASLLFLNHARLPNNVMFMLTMLVSATLPIVILVSLPLAARLASPYLSKHEWLKDTEQAFSAYLGRKRTLCFWFLCSVGIQGSFLLLAGSLAKIVGVIVHMAAWVFAWTSAKLIATLPISLGGLGVREASLAAILAPFGTASNDVIAASLLWQCVLIVAGLFGGGLALYEVQRNQKRVEV